MYQLRPPAAPLRRFIEHYWFLDASEQPIDLRVDVFVDGRADLIFNFGATYLREVIGGPVVEHARSNLDAQRLMPIRITQRGRVRIAGVRFNLGGLGPFVRVPLRMFTGDTPEPVAVFGAVAQTLEGDLERAGDVETQTQLLDAFFASRMELSSSFEQFHRRLQHLIDADGRASVNDTAAAQPISGRHVERLFARYLGVPPRTVGRVLRFQKALRMLMRDPGVTLAEVAADAGYFDHAHFIKDFKRMSGGVPRGYRGYYPPDGPNDFAPNVVVFLQDNDKPSGAS